MIVLVGFMGAGKTTVGHMLAEKLGLPFVDSDLIIESRSGRSVPEIFAADGEPAFRELERAAVAAELAEHDGVLGLGGGAVLDERTQGLLAGRPVVYLETSFAELAKRVGMDRPRPLLIGINPRAQLKTLLDQRRPVYSGLARLTVATDGREPADIAAEIAALLQEATAGRRPAP